MINVTKTYLPEKEKYEAYLGRIFEKGWLTNNGELVQELEAKLTSYLEVPYLVLTANGTLALQVAAKLLQLTGEVITTPFTFVATASALAWDNLKIRFSDIEADSFNLDPLQLGNLINSRTSAIVPVHVYGNICQTEEIASVAREHGLKVIYDAAHAFGVKKDGVSAGNFGDISVFSFHSTKLFHTIEGGAIVLNSKELYDKAKLYINFGIAGPEKIPALGINAKMNEFEAAMGLCVFDDLDLIIAGRKKVYNNYMRELGSLQALRFQKLVEGIEYNYSYFPVVFPDERSLLGVLKEMESHQIFPRRYFYPSLSTLSYIQHRDAVPVAEDVSKRIACLPLYENLPESDQQRIIDIIHKRLA